MASWIVQFPLITMTSFPSCYCSGGDHWCFSATIVAIAACAAFDHPVLYTYREICFCSSESWLLLCLPFCCLTVTATLLSLLLLFLIPAQSPALEVDKKRPPKKLLLVPNFAMAEELSLSQITKLLAYRARRWVFPPIIANLAFRWRFVWHQLHQCLFSACHSSPIRKNAPFAFVGNGYRVIWSVLRLVIAKRQVQTVPNSPG